MPKPNPVPSLTKSIASTWAHSVLSKVSELAFEVSLIADGERWMISSSLCGT